MIDKTVYYPYNETFKYYELPRAGRRAHEFIAQKNQFKGGHWVLHTVEQYHEWYQRKGRFLDNLSVENIL